MGICGTDYSGYLGKMPFFRYPRIPGHELGVEVLEVGDGVTRVQPGDRCSVEPYMNCGDCYACRQGRINCCQSLQVIGCPGGYSPSNDPWHSKPSRSQIAFEATLSTDGNACTNRYRPTSRTRSSRSDVPAVATPRP